MCLCVTLPNEKEPSYRWRDQPGSPMEMLRSSFAISRSAKVVVGSFIIHRGREHILDGYSVTDFRVSAKSDSRVTLEVQRAHPNLCQYFIDMKIVSHFFINQHEPQL